jgi:CspA family cold shock protein
VHYFAIRAEGHKTLAEGDEVEFGVEDLPKGPSALDVVVL